MGDALSGINSLRRDFNSMRREENSLANEMILKKINQIKAQYAPLTTKAEAASKLAYANMMGPQFLSKMIQDKEILGNLVDILGNEGVKDLIGGIYQSASGQGSANKIFEQLNKDEMGEQGPYNSLNNSQIKKPANSLSGWITDSLKSKLGGSENKNINALNDAFVPKNNNINPESVSALKSDDEKLADKNLMEFYNNKNNNYENLSENQLVKKIIDESNGVYNNELPKLPKQKSNNSVAENAANYMGAVAKGVKLDELKAEDVHEEGKFLRALSQSEPALHRMQSFYTNTEFEKLRDKFPYYQDMQLSALKKIGNKNVQEIIGDFESTQAQMQGNVVSAMSSGGGATAKEFEYAEKLKISSNDTFSVGRGKLRALSNLEEIAKRKSKLIYDYIKKDNLDLADAVLKAEKNIDYKSIEKEIESVLAQRVRLKSDSGQIIYVTKAEAKKLVGGGK